ncbi:hypothetical protein BU17DRAFT_99664 [Hysterangium stoloniferum]|nr:hypothetical protein BU17DRAFT_99664 [Hysterangium stoloniferum]
MSSDPPYDKLPESPAALLSHTFDCLQKYVDQAVSRQTIAALAYILAATSKDYFNDVGESIGLCDLSRAPWLRLGAQFNTAAQNYTRTDNATLLDRDDLEVDFEEEPSSISADDDREKQLPSFFPKDLVEALPVARKSLSLLHAADPEHSLSFTPLVKNCEWVWSEEEIERLGMCAGAGAEQSSSLEQHDTEDYDIHRRVPPDQRDQHIPPLTTYAPGLENFKVFDLEPGTH